MKTRWTIALAALLAATVPAQAQGPLSDSQVELYAEMWAMGSICPQVGDYRVRADELADRLNGELRNASPEQQDEISALRQEKMAEISERTAAANALEGRSREQARVANVEHLLTRCQRLATNTMAGHYFRRTN